MAQMFYGLNFLLPLRRIALNWKLHPTHRTEDGHLANVPFNLTLNRGETYIMKGIYCSEDTLSSSPPCITPGDSITNNFSGTTIEALNNPCSPLVVSIFYNAQYFNGVDSNIACCADNMIEMLWPDKHWGQSFHLLPQQHVIHGDFFKIIAKHDQTDIYLDGNLVASLDKHEVLDTLLFNPATATSNQPIFVSQYFRSSSIPPVSNQKTDPELLFVFPNNHRSLSTTFDFSSLAFPMAMDTGWFAITTPTTNIANIELDGMPVAASSFHPLPGNPAESYAYLPVSPAIHSLSSTQGSFHGIAYGGVVHGSCAYYLGNDANPYQNQHLYFHFH